MRRLALEVMRALESFEPPLIGSVATGHVRAGSEVDNQLFAEGRTTREVLLDRANVTCVPGMTE